MSVRLFGKIFGLERDYLICECQYNEGYDDPAEDDQAEAADDGAPKVEVPMEPFNQKGVNQFAYFVAGYSEDAKTHDLSNWIRLPHARPECIMAARKIKKFFTGHLDAKVESSPPFPGNEADYLRCQIARIVAGASLCLKGVFVLDPEAEEGGPLFKLNEKDEEGNGGFKVM